LFKLGCHVSIAGKIYYSLDRAERIGCNTMQIFARNPRQIRKIQLSDEDISIFKEKAEKTGISPIVVHIPYTLNLATSRERFYDISVREFIVDLIEADKLGVDYLVTHLGSYKGSTESVGLQQFSKALKMILSETKELGVKILLENSAGSGQWLGSKFYQLASVINSLPDPQQVGVCLDTAHLWAAGYDISTKEGIDQMMSEVDTGLGLKRIAVVHFNDTQEDLGSRRDCHCDIAKGKIGVTGLSYILNHQSLRHAAFILETPKKSQDDDERNLKTVKKMYT